MNLLDKEVFAVLVAAVTIASVISVAEIVNPASGEEYVAIGLLNSDCSLGNLPQTVTNGDNLTLCIFLDNHLGNPALLRVVYKIGTNSTIPTNDSPSPEAVLESWDALLDNEENETIKVEVPISITMEGPSRQVALVFELWYLDPESGDWVYTGEWVHLYVTVREAALGGD